MLRAIADEQTSGWSAGHGLATPDSGRIHHRYHDLCRSVMACAALALAEVRGPGVGVQRASLFSGAGHDPSPTGGARAAMADLVAAWPTEGSEPPSAAEVLGGLYEALLGLDLVHRDGAWQLVGWEGRRKRAGAYFSPAGLVRPTVARTLAPWRGGVGDDGGALPRVCDPAMGTGAFLVAALRHLTGGGLGAGEVAQRCLFGVDRDPLAVDLARVALWIEVGEAGWPADALDGNLRVGDSLVGARSSSAAHYPLAAWARGGSSPARRALRKTRIRVQLAERIRHGASAWCPTGIADSALRADTWCAAWFWPDETLDRAPDPASWGDPSPDTRERVAVLARQHRFFHWEDQFPDVFERGGFDAVLGNPPWEIRKANSREFFSRVDPDYRSYGKQLALHRQAEYFAADPDLQRRWEAHQEGHRAVSWFLRASAWPFGDPDAAGKAIPLDRTARRSAELHGLWRAQRNDGGGGESPFRLQGIADGNSYKLFLELSLWLLRPGGRLGLLLPSGLYTDRGCTELRRELLDRNRWEWLYSFDNRDGIFGIHRSYRFGPLIVTRGGRTRSVRTAFQRIDARDWGRDRPPSLEYPRELVSGLSPRSDALLELRDTRDMAVLERWRGCPIGDAPGPEVVYSSGYHMTRDSDRFLRRPVARELGYRPDAYGHWVRGPWRSVRSGETGSDPEVLPSADGAACLALARIEDVAVPLVQGAMIGTLCSHAAGHVEGAGHRTRWAPVPRPDLPLAPQFLIRARDLAGRSPRVTGLRTAFRALTNATNERTVIATLLEDGPCGNSLGLLRVGDGSFAYQAWTAAMLGSLTFDWAMRQRLAGTNLNAHFLWESRWPAPVPELLDPVQRIVARLTHAGWRHAPRWLQLRGLCPELGQQAPPCLFALDPRDRRRLRSLLDALMADACGLTHGDLRWLLRDCDHPLEKLEDPAFRRRLDPKGFWRIDRRSPPEDRQPVLALRAHAELTGLGREAFLARHGAPGGQEDPAAGWDRCALHAGRIARVRSLAGLQPIG